MVEPPLGRGSRDHLIDSYQARQASTSKASSNCIERAKAPGIADDRADGFGLRADSTIRVHGAYEMDVQPPSRSLAGKSQLACRLSRVRKKLVDRSRQHTCVDAGTGVICDNSFAFVRYNKGRRRAGNMEQPHSPRVERM